MAQAADLHCLLERVKVSEFSTSCTPVSRHRSHPEPRGCAMGMPELIVTAVLVQSRNKSEVARDYAVSRRWVITLVGRYLAEGEPGLQARSRRPHSSPTQTPGEVEDKVVRIRKPSGGRLRDVPHPWRRGVPCGERRCPTARAHSPGHRSGCRPSWNRRPLGSAAPRHSQADSCRAPPGCEEQHPRDQAPRARNGPQSARRRS